MQDIDLEEKLCLRQTLSEIVFEGPAISAPSLCVLATLHLAKSFEFLDLSPLNPSLPLLVPLNPPTSLRTIPSAHQH